jgi:hypothetical protein
MGKQPLTTRQDARYEPYKSALLQHRKRESPPREGWGIRAGSRHAQLTVSICDLLDQLNRHYGGLELREIFRDHANQPGPLAQSIETWINYDTVSVLIPLFLVDYLAWRAVG